MRIAPLVLAAALAAVPTLAPAGAFSEGVEVKASGEVTRQARYADIELTFQAREKEQADAADQVRDQVNELIEYLREELPDTASFQARSLSVTPQSKWDDGERIITGYQVTRGIQIRSLAVENLGDWSAHLAQLNPHRMQIANYSATAGSDTEEQELTKLLKEGMVGATVSAERFASNPSQPSIEQLALAKAVANARDKARAIATASGERIGRVLRVIESTSSRPGPRPMMAMAADSAGPSPSEPDSIESGTVSVSASVTVRFSWE